MYQQLIIVGNLGGEPEMRYTPSGVSVTNFSVAVNRRWKDNAGEQQEKTTWFRVTAWQRLAELASEYLHKGQQVMVIGELDEPSVWQAKDGEYRASLDVTARQIQFLGGKQDGEADSRPSTGPASRPVADVNDDIPF